MRAPAWRGAGAAGVVAAAVQRGERAGRRRARPGAARWSFRALVDFQFASCCKQIVQ